MLIPLNTIMPGLQQTLFQPSAENAFSDAACSFDHQKFLYYAAKGTSELLGELGIPIHLHGYHYLLEAVPLVLASPEIGANLSQQLYPRIAQRYHTSASRVERSIRTAINEAWKRGTLTAANGMFGRSLNLAYDKPTNGEMIAMLTEKIRLKLYESYALEQA